ncbi:MAG: branched-chain amino acid ABC transporter permease [Deltaproteobacteria bacterium]|nr:MAG: branched-chain amino acid ABC transporter permease [Deltaproteobacteria bacterium]
MSASRFADLVVSSVLLAGLYATMAYGLSLIYGVLRVVNLAHGGVIMVGAYLAWVIRDHLGLDPYLAIPVVGAIGFGLGAAIYRGLVRRLPRGPAGGPASLLLLFGVWLVLRNIAYVLFTGNTHDIHGTYTRSLSLLGLHVALPRLVLLGVGAAIAVALHLLLRRTLIGRAIRAAAQNADSCTLVGIDVDAIYALTFGIGTALASVAGVLLATVFPFECWAGWAASTAWGWRR